MQISEVLRFYSRRFFIQWTLVKVETHNYCTFIELAFVEYLGTTWISVSKIPPQSSGAISEDKAEIIYKAVSRKTRPR